MNRHENIVCKSCGKLDFTGRCYRCLSCQDFNMCAECYDSDFTTPQHPFDHPVKCVLTAADVELYFGGEYLNDPPQSYRCPYCKQWGYNESTFLEHVSAEHVGASTLLVSTMVTLFEQQQAVRLFLEDEQLAVFASAATSRNELMSRNEGSLELYLEPLNPNGSYQRDHPVVPLTFRVSKPGAVEVAPWVAENGALSASNSNHNVDNNFLIPDPVRRQSLLDRARHRLNLDRPPLPLQQQQQQQQLSPAHSTLSDMMRFNEPLPTSRPNRLSNFRAISNQSPNQTASGRTINLFGPNAAAENVRRTFYPPGEISRSRTQRHRTPRMQMEGFPASGVRQVHVQRLRGGPGAGQAPGPGPGQRLVEFSELAHGTPDLINQNLSTGQVLLRTIEEEELQQQQPSTEGKQLEQERERFLCYPFLSSSSRSLGPPEERISFLVQRAEFVAQLFASVLCEEDLSIGITNPILKESETTHKFRNRSTSEFVGAGDSELDLKHTTKC
ncbi:E3 ubiquitin-protein ligase KCMF1 [Drosophila innubila]|uniref:E3 ubiquitin-protein ligase KCMF1 n=1 Tax=Drosophila innubila TaxID=198719 RepID=UPI00148C8835|nr:E3 ubiquitin-protein ligase KCMF1 [Drosophila innubila]